MKAVLCLPTYNERANLEPMVRVLGEVFETTDADGRVLVVDDASPDGTGELADRLAAELGFVQALHRPVKQGLGPAYLAGFRRALADGAELVLEMDCDFSHDPWDLPRLIEAAGGADLVIGSRYVPGGGTRDWGLWRRAVSRGGCLYAQAVLGVGIRDLTSGFRCFHRHVLETIDLDSVSAKGYAFQIEMAYRTLRAGFRVAEVPIVFTDREEGASKMSGGIVVEAVRSVPTLRWKAFRRRL